MAREHGHDEHAPAAEGASADEATGAVEETRATLRTLAGSGPAPETVVDRAAAAVEDLDAAVAFVEEVGVEELARAAETADDPAVRARGRRALVAFRRFRAAAAGDLGPDELVDGAVSVGEPADGDGAAGHFHPGPGTDLRDGAEATTE